MATIRKRNGRYQVQVRRHGQPTQSRTFSHRRDAEAWARQIETEIERTGLAPDVSAVRTVTVSDILERYLRIESPRKLTHEFDHRMIGHFLRQPFAKLGVMAITPDHLESYLAIRIQTVSNGTILRELSLLGSIFSTAIRLWRMPISNPVRLLRKPKSPPGRERRITSDELQRLTDGAGDRLIGQIVRFAVETGLRRSEIVRIEWRDIIGRVLRIPTSKNGHGRLVPLSPVALAVLAEVRESGSDRPFPITVNAVRLAWERLRKKVGLGDVHLHDLRHEAISRLLEKGLTIAEAASVSGHRDYRMLRRYAHLEAEKIAEKLQQTA